MDRNEENRLVILDARVAELETDNNALRQILGECHRAAGVEGVGTLDEVSGVVRKEIARLHDGWHEANGRALEKGLELTRVTEKMANGCCAFSGPGRGDCEHTVGLPGKSIPGEHDGPDDTVDAYGKPNGWCQRCWDGHRIEELQKDVARASK